VKKILIISLFILTFVLAYLLIKPTIAVKGEIKSMSILPDFVESELRNYEFKLELINQFDLSTSLGIFRIFTDGISIWIIDNNQNVHKLSAEGVLEGKYVKEGGAPFENGQLSSIRINNEDLGLVDIDKNTIRIQDQKENLKEFRKLITPIYNGVPVNQNLFIVVSDLGSESSFELVDITKTEPLWSLRLDSLLQFPTSDYAEIVSEGYFTYNLKGDVFYVPGRIGKFVCFNKSGDVSYLATTLDRTPAPKVYTKQIMKGINALMFVREPDYYVNYSASADNEFLYILSKHKNRKSEDFRSIDMYSVDDGEYFRSLAVPNFGQQVPIEIVILNNQRICILYENYSFAIFKIKQPIN